MNEFKITKMISGHRIELILEKIKEYPRFSMYQVYKMINGVKTPLRQETYTDFEIRELAKNGYCLGDVEPDNEIDYDEYNDEINCEE